MSTAAELANVASIEKPTFFSAFGDGVGGGWLNELHCTDVGDEYCKSVRFTEDRSYKHCCAKKVDKNTYRVHIPSAENFSVAS